MYVAATSFGVVYCFIFDFVMYLVWGALISGPGFAQLLFAFPSSAGPPSFTELGYLFP